MARIPEEELERIKRDVSIARLLEARGVALKRVGHDLRAHCVFHAPDDDPSLSIDPERNVFHCFGCGAKGSVIDLVMRLEGVSFRHAFEIIREHYAGLPAAPPATAPVDAAAPAGEAEPVRLVKRSSLLKLPPAVDLDAADNELVLQVLEYYHQTLKTSPEALAYLEKRGIGSPEAVHAFRIGYANRTLGLRLPGKQREDGLKVRARLTALGLLRSTGHEHYSGAVVFPVLDDEGRVGEIYGRKIRDDLREGTAYHLYRAKEARGADHRGIWNLPAVRSSGEIILCEAVIDALTFWVNGFTNVTTAYGINGFTGELLEAFRTAGTERVLIAYDNDERGNPAALELASKLAAEGITSFRVRFPHGLDANAFACKVQPAAQALAVLLRAAEYMAGPLTRPAGGGSPEAAAKAAPPAGVPIQEPAFSLAAAPPAAEDDEPIDVSGMVELVEQAEPSPPARLAPEPLPSVSPPAASDPLPATVPASPIPPAPRTVTPAEVSEHEVVMRLGERRWRARGWAKNLSFESLKVSLQVCLSSSIERYHMDTLDLHSAKQRQAFIRTAAVELDVQEETVKRDLGQVLFRLEELQEQAIRKALEPKPTIVTIEEADRQAALELLRDPKLLDRILEAFERCGVVGEETNKLVGYLAAVSRKLERPLAAIIQSTSAAGKSALMNAVLAFVPEEECVAYSAITGQSLFYMGQSDLKHKLLAIAEEEGASRASYPLKQLQSEGRLTIASTGKDPATGMHVAHEYTVEGPAAMLMTTTAIDIDEELMNRCLVLTVNEDREQTRAIHRMQREHETLGGYLAELEREEVTKLHKNAQRLLKPLRVVNPYACHLTFLDDKTRTRRDHTKYLGLIRAIALLHQHQRPVKTGTYHGQPKPYIEVTLADIEAANRLASEVLGHTLDELPPQTRRLLGLLDAFVSERCRQKGIERSEHRFSRRDVREATAWTYDQLRVHLDRLVDMEYLLVHRGSRGQSFVYELVWNGEGQDGRPFLMGLSDLDRLAKAATTETLGTRPPALGGQDSSVGVPLGRHWAPVGAPLGGDREAGGGNGGGHPPTFALAKPQNAELPEAALEPGHSLATDRSRGDARREPGDGRPDKAEDNEQLLSLAAASQRGRR